MKSQASIKKALSLHDLFMGCLFITIASFFITTAINTKIADNSIYNNQSIAGK